MTKIRVKAAVVDTKKLLLYKEDGTTVSIPQGDPRIQLLIDQILPVINIGGVAEVDLMIANQYRDFEQTQSEDGGLVRFFRTARRKLSGLFGSEPESPAQPTTPGVYGEIPIVDANNSMIDAIQEIIANSQPVTATDFNPEETQAGDTIIAVVENDGGDLKIIPGVEALKDIIEHSAKNRNTIGVQNLLKRMAGYIDQRQHSVEDLLRFLEKGDLPIADDGSILAYKRLYSTDTPGVFVDPHTRKVTQKVGSRVCVAEELVDKNRRNECSNGLHIGRRAYMGGFSGDAMFLCKIAPEDVIVVPHNDPNKVRVCAYHILAQLPQAAMDAICRNEPMTEIPGLPELLGKALKGNHVAVLEQVEIRGQKGNDLRITPTGEVRRKGPNRQKDGHNKATAIDDKRNRKAMNKVPVTVDVVELATTIKGTRQEHAQSLFNIIMTTVDKEHRFNAAVQLVAFQKKTKIGWDRLGIDKLSVDLVRKVAADKTAVTPIAAPKKPAKPKSPAKASKTPSKAQAGVKAASDPAVVAQALVKDTPAPASKKMSQKEILRVDHDSMQDLIDMGSYGPAAVLAQKLLAARKAAKKSWANLGLPDITDEDLLKIANQTTPASIPPKVRKPRFKRPTAEQPRPNPGPEKSLPANRQGALDAVRAGATISAASKTWNVHRRTIERDLAKFGK